MRDLSVLIPSRSEMFLGNTVEDLLKHKEGNTEVRVVLDGAPPVSELPKHRDLHVTQLDTSIGQRAATNLAARMSTAKYVMKCDAHCSFDQGFDVKMMADMQDHWTMVPKMYNLHVFDWVCACGNRKYQGPTPEKCDKCGEPMKREILWHAKRSPETTAMRFDKDLKFQYWSAYKKQQEGDLVETMSLLGACWMLTRDKYWELNICDEGHVGGWGQQGTEVACKTWLSGGRLICTKKTWFAHMFRTQGADFGFPYPLSGRDVDKVRAYSKSLFIDGKWSGALYPLSWLIDRFAPVPGWEEIQNV